MGILKRFLSEDLAPLVRRSPGDAQSPPSPAATTPQPDRPAPQRVTSPPGLRMAILSWSAGENDPFTVISETVRQHFHACGKNAEVIEVAYDGWQQRVSALAANGSLEFAMTWQGLGSATGLTGDGTSFWDQVKVPLVCIHGDHPSHMPANHEAEGRYCHHLYTNAEFARYSNRHFRRARSAGVVDIPQLHREPPQGARAGDFFVVIKNLDDPVEMERRWREQSPKHVADAFLAAAETLKVRIASEPYVEFHDVLNDLAVRNGWDFLSPAADLAGHHRYHSNLDFYVHAHKSIAALDALAEVPVRVYGRGWERIARTAPPHHAFAPGSSMAASQRQYYSTYGIIDVSPAKRLHDRTRRAMVNGTNFLSSANLEDSFNDLRRFAPLFFDFTPGNLGAKVAAVMRDPDGHAELAQAFADAYHTRFHASGFVNRVEQVARSGHGY